MSVSAKSRCTPEWREKQRLLRATKLDLEMVRYLYEAGHSQNEIASMLGVGQKAVWRFMKNNGIPARTAAKRNQFGDKNSYWNGGRITYGGYVLVASPGHPRAKECGGYVREHILVAEKTLGRSLLWFGRDNPQSEVAHHKNGNKADNRPENLKVMSIAEHTRIHDAIRRRAKGGET